MDCIIFVAKTRALISCAVTGKLICAFAFAYEKRRFSHDVAHMCSTTAGGQRLTTVCTSVQSDLCLNSMLPR